MKAEEIAKEIENRLGLKTSIESDSIIISDGIDSVKAKPSELLMSIALWVEPKKAWSVLKILYGSQSVAYEAYEEYKELPYSPTGKTCWLYKALAKAVEQRIGGVPKSKVLRQLEDKVYRRWPNVCGEIDAQTEVTKLVTELNSLGISSSLTVDGNQLTLRIGSRSLTLERRSPISLLLVKELRKLANEDLELLKELIEIGNKGGCEGLVSRVLIRKKLAKYPTIRSMLENEIEEIARDLRPITRTQ
ncbi:hypothetical protein EYM_04350 [Ignicoccus islandicus DSM 13165]|uniref:Uncharacterized protein n=1 Tax=Ignicoccus islandicus DSM 13165 TaxID=940295 RepID=A0A0U2U8U1_9CREN|nr:hypothetical protein [Ignicoccus islandicus]ALU12484.1 hypothetical protein EYM_04350 [Ignicoccus islandicus DSM 13165]